MNKEKQINALKKLGCSDEEIKDILESDNLIDKGEKLFELTTEQKKAEKSMKQVAKAPTVYKFTKREKKKNETKAKLIQMFAETAKENCGIVKIVNSEREFLFTLDNITYKIVMSVPRNSNSAD